MLQVDSNFLYLLIFRVVSIYLLALFSGSHGKLVWKVKVSIVVFITDGTYTHLYAVSSCKAIVHGSGKRSGTS